MNLLSTQIKLTRGNIAPFLQISTTTYTYLFKIAIKKYIFIVIYYIWQ